MSMAKRANGEGSWRKRADGRWEASFLVGYHDDGRKKVKTFYGRSRQDVQRKVEAWKADIHAGLRQDRDYLFGEFADSWFEHHKDNITPTTQEGYKYTLRILKAHFGDWQLRGIKPMHVEEFLKSMRAEGRSDSYIAGARAMLYQIFNRAEANDVVLKNPVRFAEKMRSRGPVKRREAYTKEEVLLLMKYLPMDRTGMSIRLMIGTGMRTQELLALEPRHISEDGVHISIEQAVVRVKGTVVVGPPKSQKSYRCVIVPTKLRPYAIALRNTNKKFIWEEGKKDSPCSPSYFADLFKKAISAIEGVRVLTPHCCRHTYVSQMQAIGVSLTTIQSFVGHATPDMTNHYLHVQDPVRKSAAEKFSDEFCNCDE